MVRVFVSIPGPLAGLIFVAALLGAGGCTSARECGEAGSNSFIDVDGSCTCDAGNTWLDPTSSVDFSCVADCDGVPCDPNGVTAPTGTDSDGDCIPDEHEVAAGLDPASTDTDGDGLADGLEDRNCNGVVNPNETDPGRADSDDDGLSDGTEDANGNGRTDDGETDPTNPDSDFDELPDGAEVASVCTDPLNPDVDGDGILDGLEDGNGDGIYTPGWAETNPCDTDTDDDGLSDGCEDRNLNGQYDVGETIPTFTDTDGDGIGDGGECVLLTTACVDFDNPAHCPSDPRDPDTDDDSLPDGVERGSSYANGPTHPRQADTDGDGLSDGLEDRNLDGSWQPGELDPTLPQTNPGVPDGDSPLSACRIDNLRPVQEVVNENGDWKWVIGPAFTTSSLSILTIPDPRITATTADHPSEPLSAFIISKKAETGAGDASTELAALEARLGLSGFFPRSFSTWDGFDARSASYTLGSSASTHDARNGWVASILGVPPIQLSGLPAPGGGSGSSYHTTLTVIYRTADRVIVVGAVTPDGTIPDATSVLMKTLTGISSVAQSRDMMVPACDLFNVQQVPVADFVFIIDDTASMDNEQNAVRDATDAIFDAINQSFLDARWTVASTEYSGSDGVSSSNVCGMLNAPRGAGGSVWSTFDTAARSDFECKVKDPGGIQGCDPPPDNFFGYAEYGLKCSKVAIDYVQGRSTPAGTASSNNLQRPGSALISVIMTDEEEYEVISASSSAVSALVSQYDTFYNVTASNTASYGLTTPFAIVKQDGTMPTYDQLFSSTPPVLPRSTAGDIDDTSSIPTVINAIIQAAGGIASTFNPGQTPVVSSMKVVVGHNGSVTLDELTHSLSNGWDYDAFSNAVVFYGASRPQPMDDIALSYQYFIKVCKNDGDCDGD